MGMETIMSAEQKTKAEAFEAVQYLKRPYGRLVTPEDDGTFRAEIPEFPGCLATGDTALDALVALEDVALCWLEAAHSAGLSIPEPMGNVEYSGRLVARLPKSLHKKAAIAAERDGVSLNTFIVNSIAEQVGSRASKQATAPSAQLVFITPSAPSIKLSSGQPAESQLLPYVNFSDWQRISYTNDEQITAPLPDTSTGVSR